MALFLNLKNDQLVLFADIIGFSNAVMENENVTMADKDCLIYNLEAMFNHFTRNYSSGKQEQLNIKLLWVSDSIVISTPKENVNQLFRVLVDITNTLYCIGFLLRGAIGLGKLYHENNIWGPALIDAVEMESGIAVYPRVILRESILYSLNIGPKYKDFIEISETPGYMQFDYFDCYIFKLAHEQSKVTLSTLSVYAKNIWHSYEKAEDPRHLIKYVWLAEKLSAAIDKHSDYIDSCAAIKEKRTTLLGKLEYLKRHTQYLDLLKLIKLDKPNDQ